jgi:hypothetical protein
VTERSDVVMPRMAWMGDVPDLCRREPMLTGRIGGALYPPLTTSAR